MLSDPQASHISNETQRKIGGLSLKKSTATPLVIVLDDHLDNLMLIAYTLESWSIKCLTFPTAEAFFSAIRGIEPDILLIDIQLPDSNGFEVFDAIRQDERFKDTPILAMTALCDSKAQHDIQTKGFTDCLRKPFRLRQLKELLSRHLDDSINENAP